jgi:protein TonB
MLATLLESQSRRERSAGQLLVSVAAHTAIIGAALYATASARHTTITMPRIMEIPIVYHSLGPKLPTQPSTPKPSSVNIPDKSWSTITQTIPIEIPPVTATGPTFDPGTLAGTTLADLPGGKGLRDPAPVYNGAAMRAEQVEKEAAVAAGNSPPRYPEALRSAGVEGRVVATFVISAEGRYEEGSLRFVKSDNPLFERAVQMALSRMRFIPAEIGGRKVRQLVEMPFVFTLQR